MNTIIINAHTRTGSELLLAILRSRGYYTLGEIVTNSVPQSFITNHRRDPNFEHEYFEQFNRGLRYLLNDTNAPNKVVKVMINHRHAIRPYIYQYATSQILLHRQDMFASQISHGVAMASGQWIKWGSNQPLEWKSLATPFTGTLDAQNFEQRLQWRISDYEELLESTPPYTRVVMYDELVEYARAKPHSLYTIPTDPPVISNIEELQDIYYRYLPRVEAINGRITAIKTSACNSLDSTDSTDTTFAQYLDSLC